MPLSPGKRIPMTEEEFSELIADLRKDVQQEFDKSRFTPEETESIKKLAAQDRFDKTKGHTRWYGYYGYGWDRAKKLVKQRSGGVCEKCKKRVAKQVHHKLPVRFFELPEYAHFLENLIHLCRRCHIKAHRDLANNLPLLDMALHFSKRKARNEED